MLTPKRYNDIFAEAYGFLDQYFKNPGLKGTGKPFKPSDIIEVENERVTHLMRDLFGFASEKVSGKRGVIWFHELKVVERKWGNPSAFGRPAAWLWKWVDGNGAPTAFIDEAYLRSEVFIQHRNRTLTRIVLHEIGHLLLHWCQVEPKSWGPAISASSALEEEAWYFSGCVVAIALGHYAAEVRQQKKPDDTWKYAG